MVANIGILYALNDIVAEVDLILSLTDYAVINEASTMFSKSNNHSCTSNK